MFFTLAITIFVVLVAALFLWAIVAAIRSDGVGTDDNAGYGDLFVFERPLTIQLPDGTVGHAIGGRIISEGIENDEFLVNLNPTGEDFLGSAAARGWIVPKGDVYEIIDTVEDFKKYKVVDGYVVKSVDEMA